MGKKNWQHKKKGALKKGRKMGTSELGKRKKTKGTIAIEGKGWYSSSKDPPKFRVDRNCLGSVSWSDEERKNVKKDRSSKKYQPRKTRRWRGGINAGTDGNRV